MFSLITAKFLRASVLLLLLTTSVHANKLECLAEPPYHSPKLSPDGVYVAVIAKDDVGKKCLLVVKVSDLKTNQYYPRNSKKEKANVLSFEWVTADTLIVISDAFKNAQALHSVKVGDRVMDTLESEGKFVIVDRNPSTSRYLVTHQPRENEWGVCTVEERDVSDPDYRKELYTCSSMSFECVTDSNHEPRIIKKNKGENEEAAWYWNNGSQWVETSLSHWTHVHGFQYGQRDIAFVGGWLGEALPALFLYNLETGEIMSKLLEDQIYSLDRFAQPLCQGHPRAVLGYCLDIDIPRDVWLSNKLKGIQEQVDEMFKGTLNLIRSWDEKHEHLLVERKIMDSPSHLVWVEVKTQVSKIILIDGGRVEAADVGRSVVVQVKNRVGIDLTAMITLPKVDEMKGLPLVVYIREEPWDDLDRYEWCPEAQYMAANGLVVLRMNMRGSAGMIGVHSADLKTEKGLTGIFQDIEDGIAEVLKTGIIDPTRIGIAGSGKGAWIAACAPIVSKGQYKAVVALNGVYDLLKYRETAEDEDTIKSTIQMPFADPGSGLSDVALARFSPQQHMDNYADALFVSSSKWSNSDFKSQTRRFMSEARKNDVLVRTYGANWWGNQMNPDQRMRAWHDGVDLLVDVLSK